MKSERRRAKNECATTATRKKQRVHGHNITEIKRRTSANEGATKSMQCIMTHTEKHLDKAISINIHSNISS